MSIPLSLASHGHIVAIPRIRVNAAVHVRKPDRPVAYGRRVVRFITVSAFGLAYTEIVKKRGAPWIMKLSRFRNAKLPKYFRNFRKKMQFPFIRPASKIYCE
ncbi:hypothetical protein CHH67_09635 [Paenibacillus campinasensis]|uniref:Uncharacterized protein n=1 Tax=Paenibacillus campinasensis TaxID=66347 RepID=A0A268EVY3_9BACL|nr:hypothetical protein CHH67_09635 [Paenibacillus campinasensis]